MQPGPYPDEWILQRRQNALELIGSAAADAGLNGFVHEILAEGPVAAATEPDRESPSPRVAVVPRHS